MVFTVCCVFLQTHLKIHRPAEFLRLPLPASSSVPDHTAAYINMPSHVRPKPEMKSFPVCGFVRINPFQW